MFSRPVNSPRSLFVTSLGLTAALVLQGCMYALPAPTPPAEEQVRVIAASPSSYVLRLRTWSEKDYDIPVDGSVTLDIPSHRPTCRVYLFGVVKVGGGKDPMEAWRLDILRGGKTVQSWPLDRLYKLPPDASGYRTLKIDN